MAKGADYALKVPDHPFEVVCDTILGSLPSFHQSMTRLAS